MAAADTTTSAPVLKELYPQTEIARIYYKNAPFAGMISKRTDFYGSQQRVALRYGTTTGRSASFLKAQANKNPNKYAGFQVTRVRDYSLASITTEARRAASNTKGGIVDVLTEEIDGALESMRRSLQISMYRNGGGAIGVVATGGISTTVATLSNVNDIVNFEVGMHVTASVADGTSGSESTNSVLLSAVNRDAGTLTATTNWSTIGATDAWFLFQEGDFGAKIKGLDAWIPSTAPSATTFFGVDRSVDPTRLGGVRWSTDSGAPIAQAIKRGAARLAREGGTPDVCFLNPIDYVNFELQLDQKVIYIRKDTDIPEVGFDGIRIAAPSGMIDVFPDPNCQSGVAWLLQLDTWTLWTLGEIGFLDDLDKMGAIMEQSADAVEYRLGMYGQQVCDAPGYNARITLY